MVGKMLAIYSYDLNMCFDMLSPCVFAHEMSTASVNDRHNLTLAAAAIVLEIYRLKALANTLKRTASYGLQQLLRAHRILPCLPSEQVTSGRH